MMRNIHFITVTGTVELIQNGDRDWSFHIKQDGLTFVLEKVSLRQGDVVQVVGQVVQIDGHSLTVLVERLEIL